MTGIPTIEHETLWAAWCRDRAGKEAERLRKELAAAHFAHVEAVFDRIAVAGPWRDGDGNIAGSLLVFRAEDEGAARALLKTDPYAGADIWESVELRPFLSAAGTWIGGKVW